MSKLKKIMSTVLACVMMLSSVTGAMAVDASAETNETLVTNFFESIGDGNWVQWTEFFAPSIRGDYQSFVSDVGCLANNVGILTVKTADVISVEKVGNEYAPKVYPELMDFFADESLYECYKVDLQTTVKEGNGYFANGVSSHLVITVQENGVWYIGAFLGCPESLAGGSGVSARAARIGYGFCNLDGEVTSIKVMDEAGTVHTVSLDDFTINVTCNEIGNMGYHSDALKANVIAVKMCGWWAKEASYREAYGCDIKNGDVNYRSSLLTTDANTRTVEDAVADMDGYIMVSSSATGGKLFFASFWSGSYNDSGAGVGRLRQNGSNYLATELGYSWTDILHYYYDNSAYNNPNVGTVQIFEY